MFYSSDAGVIYVVYSVSSLLFNPFTSVLCLTLISMFKI